MVTIFDELADYGYTQNIITRLKEEWFYRLSEHEIKMIFVDNKPLLHKLMACVPKDATRAQYSLAMIHWQNALVTDRRRIKYHPLFKDGGYNIKFGIEGTVKDPRDGKVYKTVQLSAAIFSSNGPCHNVGPGKIWFAENITFESKEGFYSYQEARFSILPGWHLPTIEDVTELQKFCDMYIGENAPTCLKSANGWDSNNGLDSIGFNALPLGYIDYDNDLVHVGNTAAFWLDNKKLKGEASSLSITDYSPNLLGEISTISGNYRLSVRLVKD